MSGELTVISENEIMDYVKTFTGASALTVGETKQFVNVAKAFNLNPFKREIYAIPYDKSVMRDGKWVKERQLSIITGYEVYLKRAERTDKLDGWEVKTEGEDDAMKAIITIHRKDWKHPFHHEVYFTEVAKKDRDGKPQSMWKTMPKFMLKKVCVAQAFRMAFPDEFGGMPYTADELPDNMTKGHESVSGTGTAEDPEVIPPPKQEESHPAQSSAPSPEPGLVVGEGELIPNEYWKKSQDEKRAMLAPGCKAEKLNGKWICVRKQAS